MQNFTHMYGPLFLAIYAAIFAVFFAICLVVRGQIDRDDSEKHLAPDVDPDPYQIAYLRGGTNEVLRLATFELFAKEALEEKKSRFGAITWELIPNKISENAVSPFAWEVSKHFAKPRSPSEIFRSGIASHFAGKIREWNDWIENEELRISQEKQLKLNGIAMLLAGVFAAIGLIKIAVALSTNHNNVGFAIAMLIGGSIALLLTCLPRRFNARGRKYLSAIQTMHSQYRRVSNNTKFLTEPTDATSGNLGIANSIPMLAVGLFGVAALQGSSFDGFRKTYLRSEATGGGCGASCGGVASCGGSGTSCGGGASCGGGGGCGGGCGGCGGS